MKLKRKNKYNVAEKEDRTWTGEWRGRIQTITFDSKKEMEVFIGEILILAKDKQYLDVSLQEKFILSEGVKYYADFYFYDIQDKKWHVVDVKGRKTQVYQIKKKLFKKTYPEILFEER